MARLLLLITALGLFLAGIPLRTKAYKPPSPQLIEARILRSTLRLQVDYWLVAEAERGYLIENSVGHGTVKEGRYLVTHNHFGRPFAGIGAAQVFTHVRLYDASGEEVAALSGDRIFVAHQEAQTLVLDFGLRDGQGFFHSLGLPSADFAPGQTLDLPAGSPIAQVDWDGTASRVDWTVLSKSGRDLALDDGLLPGASGGGVYWQGRHVGNNWTTVEELGRNGAVLRRYSVAAANSEFLCAPYTATDMPRMDLEHFIFAQ